MEAYLTKSSRDAFEENRRLHEADEGRAGWRPTPFVSYTPTLLGSQSDIDAIAINGRVRQAIREALAEIGSFVWPTGMNPDRWEGFRTNQASNDRAFEEIAPEEVRNAVVHALRFVPVAALTEEELLRSALELLGYRRKTEKIERLLRYGLHLASTDGRVVRNSSGRYSLSRPD